MVVRVKIGDRADEGVLVGGLLLRALGSGRLVGHEADLLELGARGGEVLAEHVRDDDLARSGAQDQKLSGLPSRSSQILHYINFSVR